MLKLKLAEILKDRNLSQSKLARLADINQADLNSMIHCKRPAFPGWRKRISRALEMPEAEVFPEHVNEKKFAKG